MRLISEYARETKLSISFFIDRIIPAALYFLPIIIIANTGSSYQISSYSVFSSLFTSFIAIPLGFTSAVRYYSSLDSNKNNDTSGSSIFLTLFISTISVLSYLIYYFYVFYNKGYNDYHLLIIFALCILLTAPYYALTSYNEGQKNIKINNICGIISVPSFVSLIYIFKDRLDIVDACAYSFMITRSLMLTILLIGFFPKERLIKFSYFTIKKITKYGISIAILFFLQKLISTIIISVLSKDEPLVSAFQLVTVASMLLSLSSNAIFTNVFISIVRKAEGVGLTFGISLLNMIILLSIYLPLAYWSTFGLMSEYLKDNIVINIIKDNIIVIIIYFAFDVFMTASLVISRACDDTWKCQSIWCAGVIVGLIANQFAPTFDTILNIFITADTLCVVMCIFNVSKNLSIFNVKLESD